MTNFNSIDDAELQSARSKVDRLNEQRRTAEIAASDALKKFFGDTCRSHEYSIDAMRAFIMTHRVVIHGILNQHFSAPAPVASDRFRQSCHRPVCMNAVALTGEKSRACTFPGCGFLVKDES